MLKGSTPFSIAHPPATLTTINPPKKNHVVRASPKVNRLMAEKGKSQPQHRSALTFMRLFI